MELKRRRSKIRRGPWVVYPGRDRAPPMRKGGRPSSWADAFQFVGDRKVSCPEIQSGILQSASVRNRPRIYARRIPGRPPEGRPRSIRRTMFGRVRRLARAKIAVIGKAFQRLVIPGRLQQRQDPPQNRIHKRRSVPDVEVERFEHVPHLELWAIAEARADDRFEAVGDRPGNDGSHQSEVEMQLQRDRCSRGPDIRRKASRPAPCRGKMRSACRSAATGKSAPCRAYG